jgi:hypothetical protein
MEERQNMNWETIVVALIAALGPLIGTILTIRQQSHFIDYRMELVENRVKDLSDKVDKHNNFDRRLIVIETLLGIKKEVKKDD